MIGNPNDAAARALRTQDVWAHGQVDLATLEAAVRRARDALEGLQRPDGCWCFEFEADCTIPAEYVLMMHFMDEVDGVLERKLAAYLRAHQGEHGGWPLYHGGAFDLSCSVKVYYALKLAGDPPDAAHMRRAKEAILAHGGAARANVFTRIALALFGQIPWRGVPYIPVEIVLLPRWFPFHLSKVSYWSRTVMVPLFILCTLKPRAANPRRVHVRELFTVAPEEETDYFPVWSRLNRLFLGLDRVGRAVDPFIPGWVRRRALRRAERWVLERLNGEEGLGAIFPAMVNAHEALACLGYPPDHPCRRATKRALEKLLVVRETDAYCQPCVSPVWDTALACLALHEADRGRPHPDRIRALDWLRSRQLADEPGDWRELRPGLEGGGWPFQFANPHYPDLDDTSVVAWAMDEIDPERCREAVERAARWICGMQSSSGGFASFDADNTYTYLNHIPFADHGALLDPPTSDVSARCLGLLGRVDRREYQAALATCLSFLRAEQEENGSWFGRWGTNYIYGTWSVLAGLEQAGEDMGQPWVRRAVEWLKSVQQPDGGWGESNDTYFDPALAGRGQPSTPFQTAWAMLGLLAAGEGKAPEVERGAAYLLRTQGADGLWNGPYHTAPGFPRVFYLVYHGYYAYFPLWALARYRNARWAGRG
ncbi:MAG: squalene--hopene cyclase [Deferrisomatales bacterium]